MLQALALATLFAAAKPDKPPPAQLVVPERLRKEREAEARERSAASALGLTSPEVLEAAGPFAAQPGEWVEYAIRDGEQVTRLRMSVLAAPGQGEGRYWLEVASVGDRLVPTALKLLVHGSPTRPADLEKLVLYAVGQAPIELPIDEARAQLEAERAAAGKVRVDKLGRASVQVPAGSFSTERVRVAAEGGQTRLWIAKREVPLWGLVRAQSGGRSIELLQAGRMGAHSVIPEPGEPPTQGNGSESVK